MNKDQSASWKIQIQIANILVETTPHTQSREVLLLVPVRASPVPSVVQKKRKNVAGVRLMTSLQVLQVPTVLTKKNFSRGHGTGAHWD